MILDSHSHPAKQATSIQPSVLPFSNGLYSAPSYTYIYVYVYTQTHNKYEYRRKNIWKVHICMNSSTT